MLLFVFKKLNLFYSYEVKRKENIECVFKSDVDCIFKCQYGFLKL
jgi:hypothetical protein